MIRDGVCGGWEDGFCFQEGAVRVGVVGGRGMGGRSSGMVTLVVRQGGGRTDGMWTSVKGGECRKRCLRVSQC